MKEKTKEIDWNTKKNKQLIQAVLALKNSDETAAGVTPSFFAACDWVMPVLTSSMARSALI